MWEDELDESEMRSSLEVGMALDGEFPGGKKEALAVTILDADPVTVLKMPEDTTAPFWLAVSLAALFAGLLLRLHWLTALGATGVAGALVWWTWPRRPLLERRAATEEAHG